MENTNERRERLKNIVSNLPDKPGCYQYLDAERNIIYVGKAKNLKRRVSSYFLKNQTSTKTRIMVSKIDDIAYVVVPTEEDALLLENNLIKQHKPRYNILLKDDKTYPSICITNEYLPRVIKTRKIIPHYGTYYGPFSHVYILQGMMELIKKMYRVRSCHTEITPDSIAQHKHKPCLDYHIKKCLAPCAAMQSREEYMQAIAEIREILSGNTRNLCRNMLSQMTELAQQLRYEEAAEIKRRYDIAREYVERSEVVPNVSHDIDVFTIVDDGSTAYINFLHVTNGAICQAFTVEMRKKLDETPEEMLALGVVEMRERFHSHAKEIVLPFPIDTQLNDITVTIPQRGDKKHLLDLSAANAKQYRFDRLKQAEKLNPEQRATNLLKELQRTLQLASLPATIECFDNSNTMGTDAVAGCVVFKRAKPSKKDYRKYIIKTVAGPDDYASMAEVVERRYRRMIDENTPLPHLIITDGGRGQMEVVRHVVEDILGQQIPIAGLAKNDRHRTNELLFGSPPQTVQIDIKSPLFQFLTRIQDEVHRYAITFHREKRSKRMVDSELDHIKGIGLVAKDQLLRSFHSVKRIKEASEEQLAKIVGPAKARLIINHFSERNEQ